MTPNYQLNFILLPQTLSEKIRFYKTYICIMLL